MHVVILGSAAGGGVPQWNCRCPVCTLAWSGDPRVTPRTQSSIAVSPDGERWLLVNASPDIRQQIQANRAMHPRDGLRHSPIHAVLLTNGDVDHVAGLLTLREGQRFTLYATPGILGSVTDNRVFDVMADDVVARSPIAVDDPFEPVPGLRVTLFSVPGKVLEDDDMIRAGVGTKTGWRMGHIQMNGPEGSIASLADVAIGRRVFVHINNTNPVLVEASAEREGVEARGWTVAHDGLTLTL